MNEPLPNIPRYLITREMLWAEVERLRSLVNTAEDLNRKCMAECERLRTESNEIEHAKDDVLEENMRLRAILRTIVHHAPGTWQADEARKGLPDETVT